MLALVVFAIRIARGDAVLRRTPLDGPILAFCVWTLLSASFSPGAARPPTRRRRSCCSSRSSTSPSTPSPASSAASACSTARSSAASRSSAGALAQYFFLGFDTLNNRPRSFLGHYMTASGLVMAVLILAAGRVAFHGAAVAAAGLARGARGRRGCSRGSRCSPRSRPRASSRWKRSGSSWPRWPGAAPLLALLRGPWPGRTAGTFLATLVLPLAAARAAHLAHPQRVAGRAGGPGRAGRDARPARAVGARPPSSAPSSCCGPAPVMDRLTVTDASSKDRYYMWQAGIDMIREKPVFGQGPGMILAVYPDYRWPDAPNAMAPAPPRQRAADRRRARPPLPRLVAVVGGGGHGRRVPRAAARRAAAPGWRRSPSRSWPRSWPPACLNTISATPRSSCSRSCCPPSPTPSAGSATTPRGRRRMKALTRSRAQRLLAAMRDRRVLVVGDVMLDEFLWGRVARISPEAPVPVVEITVADLPPRRRRQRGRATCARWAARRWWRAWSGRDAAGRAAARRARARRASRTR